MFGMSSSVSVEPKVEEKSEEEEENLEDDFDDDDDLEYDLTSPMSLESHLKQDEKNNNNSHKSKKGRKTKRLGVKRTYGLRPRTQLRRPSYDCETEDKEPLGTSAARKEPRSKVRGSLVAKYRRLTANARERQRMKEINDAFSTLQGILPALQGRQNTTSTGGSSSRTSMTKIRTLRHAASYIQALSDLLSGGEPQGHQTFHKDLQNYSGMPLSNTSTTIQTSHPQEVFSGLQHQALTRTHVSRGLDSFKDSFQGNTGRGQGENQPPPGTERNISWEEFQTTDEELFSLLEKDVLSMRNGQLHQTDGSPTTHGDLGWNEEFIPMGCK